MKQILWLSLTSSLEDHCYNELLELASHIGISISSVSLKPPVDLNDFRRICREASGFLITMSDVVESESFGSVVGAEIRAGKRALVATCYQELNPFLIGFDLAVRSDRLLDEAQRRSGGRFIAIRKSDQSSVPGLGVFGESAEVVVSSPSSVWYGPEAEPIFQASEKIKTWTRDDRLHDCFEPHKRCVGGYRAFENGGGLALISGDIFSDPCNTLSGLHIGIRENTYAARRLLSWCVGELDLLPMQIDALSAIHSIEVALHEIVKRVLMRHFKSSSDAWFTKGFPPELQQKLLNEGAKSPEIAELRLYFVSYIGVIQHNWEYFAGIMDPEGLGPKKALKRLQHLNKIRNRLSHPVRLQAEGISDEELRFVVEEKAFFVGLDNKLKKIPQA